MAMKALICPQCTAQLDPTEEDMEKGYATCPACGTVIQFNEVQKVDIHQTVEHTGTVDVVNITQAKNRLLMAGRAFDAKNYQEAYDLYSRVLEDIPNDITALFRKGLCAVYMSGLKNPGLDNLRISEFQSAILAANAIWRKKISNTNADSETSQSMTDKFSQIEQQFERDISKLFDTFLKEYPLKYDVMNNLASCQLVARRYSSIVALYFHASTLAPIGLKLKESIIREGIAFCDQAKNVRIKYVAEQGRDKNGNIVNYYKTFCISNSFIDATRATLVKQYNNLPSRIAKREDLQGKLKTLEDETAKLATEKDEAKAKYDAATAEFWANNPDLEKQKSSKRNLFFIWAAVGLAAGVVCYFLDMLTVDVVAFIVSLIIGAIATSSARKKLEQSFFPEEIKTLKAQLDDAEKRHSEKQSELEKQKHENYEFEHEV